MPYCHIGTRNGRGNGSGCIVLIGLRVGVSCDKLREPESWTKDSSRVFNARREPQLTLAATAIFK